MSDETNRDLDDPEWAALPGCVRLITLVAALPAAAILIWGSFVGELNETVRSACTVVLVVVAILQMFFAFRAYWRMDV